MSENRYSAITHIRNDTYEATELKEGISLGGNAPGIEQKAEAIHCCHDKKFSGETPKYGSATKHDASDDLSGGQVQAIEQAETLMSAALGYATRGFRVFPCKPGPSEKAKQPYTPRGHLDATCDPALIQEWWHRWPHALIGFATGDPIWVLDLDRKGGIDAVADFILLIQIYGRPSSSRMVSQTLSGGLHLFFSRSEGIRSSASRLIPGIDVRGEGGYVILPPSKLDDNREYKWIYNEDQSQAESWVLDLARGDRGFMFKAVLEVARAVEGTRNDTLFKAACEVGRHVAGEWVSGEEASELLKSAAQIAGNAGGQFSLEEVRRTIKQGFKTGSGEPNYSPDRLLDEMNTRYCVVDVQGKACVISFNKDAVGRTSPTFYSFDQFRNLHDHKKSAEKVRALGGSHRKGVANMRVSPFDPEIRARSKVHQVC